MAKVLVATSIGPGKEYCLPFFQDVLDSLQDVAKVFVVVDGVEKKSLPSGAYHDLPPYEGPKGTYPRCARVRETARQYFLKGDWDYLYFHDADMIPPGDIIPRLLAHDVPIATGLYCVRGLTEPTIPWYTGEKGGPCATMAKHLPLKHQEHDTCSAPAFGMGCMLIRREVLEKTAFRPPSWWSKARTGEDYQFCLDSKEGVLVDLTLPVWHVDTNGQASRLVVGSEVVTGAILEDMGLSEYVTLGGVLAHTGTWHRGSAKFGLSEVELAALPPGFAVRPCREVTMEWADWKTILEKTV